LELPTLEEESGLARAKKRPKVLSASLLSVVNSGTLEQISATNVLDAAGLNSDDIFGCASDADDITDDSECDGVEFIEPMAYEVEDEGIEVEAVGGTQPESDEEVRLWIKLQGFETHTDFVFAFDDVDEVCELGGFAVAQYWRKIADSKRAANVAGGWSLWKQLDRRPQPAAAISKAKCVLFKKKNSLTAQRKAAGPVTGDLENPLRQEEAQLMWNLVESWGEHSAVMRQYKGFNTYFREELKLQKVSQWTRFDHRSLAAHRRAWHAW
jgi:hypothetical protein